MDTGVLPKTQHIVVFQEVIRSGSIGSAARQPGLSQPAVSKIMREMEACFGVEMMTRTRTGVSLTRAGQILYSGSESILRDMKNMSEINRLSHDSVTDITFGFPSLISFTVLSGMMRILKEICPKAQISMFEAQLSSLLPAIRDGRLDFAIGTLSLDMHLQDLYVELLFESRFILVSGPSWTCTGPLTLEALRNEQWILPQNDMGYYGEFIDVLLNNHIRTENIVKTDSTATIYNLVLNANFLTIIPCDMAAPFGSEQFITLPMDGYLPVAQYAAVWFRSERTKK